MPKPPRAGLALAARAGPKGSRRQLLEEGLSCADLLQQPHRIDQSDDGLVLTSGECHQYVNIVASHGVPPITPSRRGRARVPDHEAIAVM